MNASLTGSWAGRWAAAVLAAAALALPGAGVAQEDLLARGAAALRADDPVAARAAFQRAAEADPEDAAPWLGLSAAAELESDWAGALLAARRALALAPERAEPHLAVGRLLARYRRVGEALAAFERARELAPDEVDGYLLPAVLLRDANRAAEALTLLELAYERFPTAVVAEQLALVALELGEPALALAVADERLASAPRRGGLLLAKALALAADPERRAEASEWFARALEAGVGREGRVRLEWGRLLTELGRWAEAADQLERAAALLPEEGEVFFRLAAARRQLGDAAGAAGALGRYQELQGESVAAQRRVRERGTALNEAQELAAADRLEEALERLESVPGGEADPRVAMLRAKTLFSMERTEEAFDEARRAASLAPFELEPMVLEGLLGLSLGRYDEALRAVERALTLDPGFGEAWALRGSALGRSSRPDEAAASFERALELGFDSPALRLDYAAVLRTLGREEESRRQMEARERLIGG